MTRYGKIEDESIESYHSNPALSHSKVSFFENNFPLTYHQKYTAKVLEPEGHKEHYDIGHAVEARLIGSEAYSKLVTVNTTWADFKSAAARQWRDEARAAGMIPFSPDNHKLVHRMYDAVMRNPDAVALLQAGTPQVTFRKKGRVVDVQCRCDWFGHAGAVLPSDGQETGPFDCDLKSIESLSPSAFIGFDKQAMQLGYHRAAVWYRYVIRAVFAEMAGEPEDALPFVKRYFIVVDKKEYPSCTVYTVPDVLLDAAERDLLANEPPGIVPRLISCYERNEWPDAPVRSEIEVPRWL